MVDIVIDENLINHVNEYDAILISTNCYQSMRNGFQYEIIGKYPHILEHNYSTKYGDKDKLGTISICEKENCPTFILMFNTFLYNFRNNNKDFFDYESLENCLKRLNILYKGEHFASTMIGCSEFDGNGDKEKILKIINDNVIDFDLTIYDYKQDSYEEIEAKKYYINLKKRYARNKEKFRRKAIRDAEKLARKNKSKKRMQQRNCKNN